MEVTRSRGLSEFFLVQKRRHSSWSERARRHGEPRKGAPAGNGRSAGPDTYSPASFRVVRRSAEDEETTRSLRPLRRLIGLYIFLWIFEGALRKWILPQLSNPLLVVRDPVLLLIYAIALSKGLFPRNGLVTATLVIGFFSVLASFTAEVVNFKIIAFGFRADFLHLPLVFLMPKVVGLSQIRVYAKWFCLIAIPMAILVLVQFTSPPSAKVNVGAGGGESGQIESALGKIRPPGTFSYNNGLTGFSAMVAAFILAQVLQRNLMDQKIFRLAAPALVVMVAMSGSRTSLGIFALVVAALIFICFLRPDYFQRSKALLGWAILIFIAFLTLDVFKDVAGVFGERFNASGQGVAKGFIGRFLGQFLSPFDALAAAPTLGIGLGMGTNAAAGMLYGERLFLVAEGELQRVIYETGPVLGFAFIFLRLGIVVHLFRQSLHSLRSTGNALPLLMFAGCFNEFIQGQFGQPTSLGYAIVGGSLCLASTRDAERVMEEPVNDEKETSSRKRSVKGSPRNRPPRGGPRGGGTFR
jgi:hypothetical protein